MKRGRAAARARERVVAVAMTLAVMLAAAAPAMPTSTYDVSAQGGTGTIVHSSDGVLLRAEPAYDGEVLTTLAEGTAVDLRTDAADTVYDADGVTQWWPVRGDGADGWVAGFYLKIAGFSDAQPTEATDSASSSIGGGESEAPAEEVQLATWDLANAAAVVSEPEGVNLRQDPGSGSPAVKSLAYDTVVQLRIDEVDTVYTEGSRWWPVRVEGLIGWVSGAYLAPTDSPAPAADDGSADIPGKVADWFSPGSYVIAQTDDGSGINIRADGAPDAEEIGIVPEGDVVQVMDGPYYDPIGNPWYMITNGEVTGYVAGWFLGWADQPGADQAPEIPSKVSVPGVATGKLDYPLAKWVLTQGFGCSPYWFEPWVASVGCNFHNGVDLAADMYSPIGAADGGVVEYAGWCDCGLGYYVKIDHGNGFETVYGHMSELYVSAGEPVSKGDVIGTVGSTGNSTGPHVHFIVEYNGVDEDPLSYIG
ncbi:MAG: peptidoglycan DD-metalloendopeptidase family protein [Thermomicrobiales bacterium]